MSIQEIMKALHEVSRICAQQRYCTDCPLSYDGKCPTWDVNGESTDYPEYWTLNLRNADGGAEDDERNHSV